MKANMGTIDQAIRITGAIAIAVLYFTDVISGVLAIVLGILAIVFVITSFIKFCPLYLPFKITTLKNEKK